MGVQKISRQQTKTENWQSTSKGVTVPTPPLLSAVNPEDRAVLSKPSQGTANSKTYTISMPTPSANIKFAAVPTVPAKKISDGSRKHALFAKVSILQLEKAGLCFREKVLAADGTVAQIRVVFDPSLWTESIELKD